MITEDEYKEAINKVMDYVREKQPEAKSPKDIGCKVKLSVFGLEMQGKNKAKLRGVVIAWNQWMNYPNDGTVTIKWDQKSKPEDMHISHVEEIK